MATGVTSSASNSTATRCPRVGCTSSGPRTPTDRARPPSTLARENQSPSAWRAIETKRPSPGMKETAASCARPGQRFAKKNAAGQNATSQIPCDRLRVTVGPATAPFPSTFLGEGKTRQQTQPVCGLCWEGPGGCLASSQPTHRGQCVSLSFARRTVAARADICSELPKQLVGTTQGLGVCARVRSAALTTTAFLPPVIPLGGVPDGAQPGRRADDRIGDQDPEVL